MRKRLLIIFCLVLFLVPFKVGAVDKIDLYLFHSKTCPHCKEEINYLEELKKSKDNLVVHLYEVTENKDNSKLLKTIQSIMDEETNYVPFTIIGNKVYVGFSSNTKLKIENTINAYADNYSKYIDVVDGILNNTITKDNYREKIKEKDIKVSNNVSIPFLGEVNPKNVSLPLIAVIIGLVDGFNPCAMWVLVFLISMLLNMKNKKRMWSLGLTFLFTSAIVYLLFMVAWLNIVVSITGIRWIQILIALVALIGAFINFRSYVKERKKDNGCVVVDDKKRKKIFSKIKKFTSEKSFLLAMCGVIALAISVNLVELACSAGLPLLFTQILALNNLSSYESILYIFIYIFFFLIDDLIVFVIAMFTLKITGVTTKYTKYTHLIGGLIMFLIGLLMIIKPEWIMFNF